MSTSGPLGTPCPCARVGYGVLAWIPRSQFCVWAVSYLPSLLHLALQSSTSEMITTLGRNLHRHYLT